MEPVYEKVEGRYGVAEPLEVPVIANAAETVCQWLLTAPSYHPYWGQYYLLCTRLTDGLPGWKDPVHHFEGSTHELMVFALNPADDNVSPHTAGALGALLADGKFPPILTPVNVCEQFTATDDEMRRVTSLCAQAVVHGALNPDSDGRSRWRPAIEQTLAHGRGEAH